MTNNHANNIPMDDGRNGLKSPWTIRRRIIYTTLIICAGCTLYIMIAGEDTRVNETIVLGCFSLAGAVISTYCFSAVWSDNSRRNTFLTNHREGNIIVPSAMMENSYQRKQKARERLDSIRAGNNQRN